MTTVNINVENFDAAALNISKAKSILLMVSSIHQEADGVLNAHDLDNVVSTALDLLCETDSLLVYEGKSPLEDK